MKRLCKWCLKAKILIVELASTGIFLAFGYAVVRHELAVLLK
jgi:hypothetical protein